jgi:hypothetical protein
MVVLHKRIGDPLRGIVAVVVALEKESSIIPKYLWLYDQYAPKLGLDDVHVFSCTPSAINGGS